MIRCFFTLFVFLILTSCKEKTAPLILENLVIPQDTSVIDSFETLELVEVLAPKGWTHFHSEKDLVFIDIRYATPNNFTKEKIYPCGECFVRDTFATILQNINKDLIENYGYRLKFFDCYRPSPVQQKLWDKFPNPSYVTNPKKGSMHNRGMAVDITLVDEQGVELDMGTAYDFFGEKAHYAFQDLPQNVKDNRTLLRTIMEKHGCKGIRTEWWHFSLKTPSFELADWEWECN